jgi:ABC-type antimicrobial peptide transport system permease subunit
VSQRVREFAVRLALGARPGAILTLVLREGAFVTIAGLAIGFALAPTAAQMLGAALFGVGPTDTVAYVAAGSVLCGSGDVRVLSPGTPRESVGSYERAAE